MTNKFKVWDIVELVDGCIDKTHALYKKKMKILNIVWDSCIVNTWDQAYSTMKLYYWLFILASDNNDFYINLMSE